jgi:hypothetical protein
MPGPKKQPNPMQRILEDPKMMFAALGGMGVFVVAVWAIGTALPGGNSDLDMVRTEAGQSKWTKTAKADLEVKRPVSSRVGASGLRRSNSIDLTNAKKGTPSVSVPASGAAAASADSSGRRTREVGVGRTQDAPSGLPEHEQPDVHDQAAPDSTALVQSRPQAQGDALNGFDTSSNGGFASGGYGGAPVGDSPAAGTQKKTAASVTQVASTGGSGPAIRGQMPGRSFLKGTSGGGSRRVPGRSPGRQATAAGAGSAGTGQSGFLGAGGSAAAAPQAGAKGGKSQSAFAQAGGHASAGHGAANGMQFPGGGGGGGGGRGDLLGGPDSRGGGSHKVRAASKREIKNQAKEHFNAAANYRKGVAVPMLSRQRASATAQSATLKAQSTVLNKLTKELDKKIKEFRDLPEAHSLLVDAKNQIAGKNGMRARIDSARNELSKGANRAKYIPNKCQMRKTVTSKVWTPAGGFWKRGRGDSYNRQKGEWGQYVTKKVTTEYRTLSLQGQDMMDAGMRRAKNVGIEAQAGADMTGNAFGPVIDSLRAHKDPKQAARADSLEGIAIRIQSDLDKVASKLPSTVARVGSVAGKQTPHKNVRGSALSGARKFKELNAQIGAKGPGYPEIGAKQGLFRAMTDSLMHSESALISINAMSGGVHDNLDSLHGAGQSATKAYVRLCDSYNNLKALERKAKK